MKTSPKHVMLVALCAAGVGFTTLTSGCAGTTKKESTGEYVDDSSITVKVKAALVKDPVVKAADVKVQTFKGTVQLSGFVNTANEKDQAARVASMVGGVTNVQNDIVVK